MSKYRHDEWCATMLGATCDEPCDCYVRLLEERDAHIEALERIKTEAERIRNEAHYRGDIYGYDLMRTILAAEGASGGPTPGEDAPGCLYSPGDE